MGALSGGWGSLAQYGINYQDIFPRPGAAVPDTRYVAIGASFLNGSTIYIGADKDGKMISDQQRVDYLAAYRTRQPEAILGNTIYVYRVR